MKLVLTAALPSRLNVSLILASQHSCLYPPDMFCDTFFRGEAAFLSLLPLFQLHSPHLAVHSARKRLQRRLVPLLPNAGCYHDLVLKKGGAGWLGVGVWYSRKAPSGAEIIRMLPRAQPQPLTGSDCAKPWTDRGIRISIHSRLTQSLIDLDLGAERISLTGRPPQTPLIEPSSVCSENSHRYLNTYCFCLWHRPHDCPHFSFVTPS